MTIQSTDGAPASVNTGTQPAPQESELDNLSAANPDNQQPEGDLPEGSDADDNQPFPRKAQNAIAREKNEKRQLRAQLREAQQYASDVAALRAEIAQLKSGGAREDKRPSEETWTGDFLSLVQAQAQWDERQKLTQEFQKQQQDAKQRQEAAQYEQWAENRFAAIGEQISAELAKSADLKRVYEENLDVLEMMPNHISHLFYQLDPASASKAGLTLLKEGKLESLYRMPAAIAAAEIGRAIERSAAVIAKTISKAPHPMTPNRGGGGVTTDDSMSGTELRRKYGI